jgi:hypothetical protein
MKLVLAIRFCPICGESIENENHIDKPTRKRYLSELITCKKAEFTTLVEGYRNDGKRE